MMGMFKRKQPRSDIRINRNPSRGWEGRRENAVREGEMGGMGLIMKHLNYSAARNKQEAEQNKMGITRKRERERW